MSIQMQNKEETVPCRWCQSPTTMTATRECDTHWELRRRITAEPTIAQRILNAVKT